MWIYENQIYDTLTALRKYNHLSGAKMKRYCNNGTIKLITSYDEIGTAEFNLDAFYKYSNYSKKFYESKENNGESKPDSHPL